MNEESKRILLEGAIEEAKKPGLQRYVFTCGCFFCVFSFAVFPEWKSMLDLAYLFALLAIAYRPGAA